MIMHGVGDIAVDKQSIS